MLQPQARNIVVIGASAGGVEALKRFFTLLGSDVPAAFFVVLHIPAHTTSLLDHVLAGAAGMPVVMAKDGDRPQPGTVYVATPDRHLMLSESGVRVTRGPKECRVRPAIDCLFRSAAVAHGARVLGVLLSGSLDDGTAGLWAVKDCGGTALVQDPAEALFDGMPASAIKQVDVDFVGPLEALADKVRQLAGTPCSTFAKPVVRSSLVVENLIGLEGHGLREGVMELGKVSNYSCPDCHGVLLEIREGRIRRFRCHTGHAFSLKSLIAEVNEAIDDGLWETLKAVEERVMLLREIACFAAEADDAQEAARCLRMAEDAEARLEPLRQLVLDPMVFGHDVPA